MRIQNPTPTEENLSPRRPYSNNLIVRPNKVQYNQTNSTILWNLVGPERMKSRGLDPEGLREYYRQRNLLKARVKAEDVGKAVVFFASEQTPTTGATLPVDGGNPAAFPR
jgi:NAD(P)-dependent dehydrogenase (short-subunit alcohol dehydrogenase family)